MFILLRRVRRGCPANGLSGWAASDDRHDSRLDSLLSGRVQSIDGNRIFRRRRFARRSIEGLPVMRVVAILLTMFFVVGCGSTRPPEELSVALRNGELLTLYSLDPSEPNPGTTPAQTLHDWPVLGTTDVTAAPTRTSLLDALDAGIADSDGSVAACFDPRHGLRAEHNGKTYDVVICFRCSAALWYIDDVQQAAIPITRTPQPIFDRTLKSASVPLAPPGPK